MKDNNYDIAIIGAGLAGLSAALAAGKSGQLKVAIIEGASVGSNNPSPLTFTKTLDEYGLSDCAKGQLSRFAFHNYQGSSIRYSFKDRPLSVLDYRKACIKMSEFLIQGQGRTAFINTYATGFSRMNDRIVLELQNHERIIANILIDCSGKSKFAGSMPGDANTVPYYSHVYGAVFSGLYHIDAETGFFLWPCAEFGSGGGWFYPLENGQVSFGYATISNSTTMDSGQLESRFWKAVETFGPYSAFLKMATIKNIECGTIPITYSKKLSHDRIIIAGDAAGMATNWTCMGVEPALKYGSLAGALSASAITQGDLGIIGQFQRDWEEDNKATYDIAAANASLLWTPNHYLWEWIIKNDLASLTPPQLVERMRWNSHLLKKHQVFYRALIYKIKSILDKRVTEPQSIIRQTIS
jgi:flavin-dependent dehydrogenase